MSRRQPTTLQERSFRAVLADLADLDAEIDAARRREETLALVAPGRAALASCSTG
jgi:hypothetical protein